MNHSFLRITAIISSLILIAIGLFSIKSNIDSDLNYFLHSCANIDVLSWDANLRLIGVIDQLNSIEKGDIIGGFLPLLDSPTWPPLRSIIMMVVHSFSDDFANSVHDVFISTFFYITLVIIILPLAISMSGSVIRGTIAWFFTISMLLYEREIHAYIFSSMLETQGMVFSILLTYFLYNFYADINEQRGQFDSASPAKFTAIGLFLSAFGLYMTKYPYGIMLIISIGVYELVSKIESYKKFSIQLWQDHYRGVRRVAVLTIIFFLSALVFSRLIKKYIDFPADSRLITNIIYLLSLFVFIDFNFAIFRRNTKIDKTPVGFLQIYLYAILPSLIWQFLHPDRLMSMIGSQQHEQDAGRLFTESFFVGVFSPSSPAFFIAASAIIGIITFIVMEWMGIHSNSTSNKIHILRFSDDRRILTRGNPMYALKDPLVAVSFIVAGQFFILEFLTGNKQLRHIYHLMPSIAMLSALWLMRVSILVRLINKNQLFRTAADFVTQALPVIFSFYLLTLPDGIYSKDFFNDHQICFTGTRREVYDPARFFASQLDATKRYVLINLFHDVNLQAEGRWIASDFDLLMRKTVHGNLRNDNRHRIKSWQEFDELLILGDKCLNDQTGKIVAERLGELKIELQIIDEIPYPSGKFCLMRYDIK